MATSLDFHIYQDEEDQVAPPPPKKNSVKVVVERIKSKVYSPTRKTTAAGANPLSRLNELSCRLQKREALNNIINSFKLGDELLPSSNIIKNALRSNKTKIVDPSPTRAPDRPKRELPDSKAQISINVIENSDDAAKRRRKTTDQLAALREAYRKYPEWNKTAVHRVAKQTGLSVPQVYKWGWDQRRKQGEDVVEQEEFKEENLGADFELPTIDQFGGYSKGHYTKQESIMELLGINFSPTMLQKLIEPDKRLASSCETGEFRMKKIGASAQSTPESHNGSADILNQIKSRKNKKISNFEEGVLSKKKQKPKKLKKDKAPPKRKELKRTTKARQKKMIHVKLEKSDFCELSPQRQSSSVKIEINVSDEGNSLLQANVSYSRQNSAKKERRPPAHYDMQPSVIVPQGQWLWAPHYHRMGEEESERDGLNPFVQHHLNFENVEMEDPTFNDYFDYDRSYKMKEQPPKEEQYKMETPQFTSHGHPKPGILYNHALHRSYSASRAIELQQSAPQIYQRTYLSTPPLQGQLSAPHPRIVSNFETVLDEPKSYSYPGFCNESEDEAERTFPHHWNGQPLGLSPPSFRFLENTPELRQKEEECTLHVPNFLAAQGNDQEQK